MIRKASQRGGARQLATYLVDQHPARTTPMTDTTTPEDVMPEEVCIKNPTLYDEVYFLASDAKTTFGATGTHYVRKDLASAQTGDGQREDALRSRATFHDDAVEQLAFELAFELEEAELSRNDLVTVNRDKLRAIAARIISRYTAPQSTQTASAQERKEALYEFDRFCRFIDGFHDGGYVEADFLSKNEQALIRRALTTPPVVQNQAEAVRLAIAALEFYANPEIYKPHPHGLAFDDRDVSFKARNTLEALRALPAGPP